MFDCIKECLGVENNFRNFVQNTFRPFCENCRNKFRTTLCPKCWTKPHSRVALQQFRKTLHSWKRKQTKNKKDTRERKETEKKVHFGRKFRYLIHANQSLSNFCSDLVFFQGTNILRQLFFLLGWAVFSARLISKKTNYRLDDGRKMFFNQKKLFPTWEVLGKRDNTLVARLVQKIVSCFTTWNIIDVQIAFVDFHGQNLVALMEYIKLFQSMNTHLCSVER